MSMQILIVEDEPLIGLALEAVLADAGHGVLGLARSGAEALLLLERVRPDLMLVDIDLADGKSAGLALAQEAGRRWAVPVLFISAQSTRARENRDLALGFLTKPFNRATLLASVEAAQRITAGETTHCPAGLELFERPTASQRP